MENHASNGIGVLLNSEGHQYIGLWKEDVYSGLGKESSPDGHYYTG